MSLEFLLFHCEFVSDYLFHHALTTVFSFPCQELISFRDPHVMSSRLMVEKPERDVERVIDASLAEVVAGHLR